MERDWAPYGPPRTKANERAFHWQSLRTPQRPHIQIRMTKEGLAVGATFLVAGLGNENLQKRGRIVKSRPDPFSLLKFKIQDLTLDFCEWSSGDKLFKTNDLVLNTLYYNE